MYWHKEGGVMGGDGGCRWIEGDNSHGKGDSRRRDCSTPSNVSPMLIIWRLGGERGLVSSDALPDIYTFPFRIPHTALSIEIPVNILLPDSRCVADYGRH